MSLVSNTGRINAVLLFILTLAAETGAQAPNAEFSGAPRVGVAPHSVAFTNFASGSPGSHVWTFGDAGTSTVEHPGHTYTAAGTYTVSLTSAGPGGSDTETKLAYITVLAPSPLADFIASPLVGQAPTTVSFVDTSVGATLGWDWSFGDGSTSSLQNPSHTYTSPGAYSVSLSTSGPGGVHTVTKSDYIVISIPEPVAEFGVAPGSGLAPLAVQFTGLSTGDISSQSWDFGDGTSPSTQLSPTHIYTSPGTYSVTLSISGPGGTDSLTKVDLVTVLTPAPSAGFTGAPLVGISPLTVSFTDTSTGSITSWAWTFGDGGASSLQNPSHVYMSSGSYTVILITTGPGGSDLQIESDLVVVSPPAPVAAFTGTPLTGVAPLTLDFTDGSTGAITSHFWDFGDAGNSTLPSPTHIYSNPGTYSVSLTVLGPGGVDELTQAGLITVLEPPPIAAFTGTPTAGVAPHLVTFHDFSSGDSLTYSWDFGDGEVSTLASPTHTYATSGIYTISLTVTSTGGLDSETRANYIQVEEPLPLAEFSGAPLSGSGSLTTSFTDSSVGVITAHSWDLGDGSVSQDVNPIHTYNDPGVYTVTLTVSGPGGIATKTRIDYVSVAELPPIAEFSGSPTAGVLPTTTAFADQSTGNISGWAWNFGDGGTSSAQNPSHTYSTAGAHTVTLTATGPGGSHTETKTGYISVVEQAPLAEFSATPTSGAAPLDVAFTNLSTGGPTTSYAWDFGDGTTATTPNPTHMYAFPGTYTTTLTVTGPGGLDTETKFDHIVATEPEPIAQFTAGPLEGTAPLNVAFTDQSKGVILGWSWDFGGTGTSDLQDPTHTYSSPGTYSVSLAVIGPGGSDALTEVSFIVVSEPLPTASFFGVPLIGVAPLDVSFTDNSTGNVTSRLWSFGDGGNSTLENPSHTYTTQGTYTVSLTVTSSGGMHTEDRLNYITVQPPSPIADFLGAPQMGPSPLSVSFSDLTAGEVTSWSWDFGDLTTSTAQNPVKVYFEVGSYSVTLTASGPGGIDSLTKLDYVVVGFPAPIADFNAMPSTGVAPLTVSFTDATTGVVSSWSWSFGDGRSSTSQNPTNLYSSPGTYTVALSTTGPGGTDTETKTDLIFVQEPAPLASFSGTPTSGVLPLTVNFSDGSTGAISSHAWAFGDGGSSTLQDPIYTYVTPGSYTVSLVVTGPGGSDSSTLADYIEVINLPPNAEFSGTPLTGTAPLPVNFTDLTTGVFTAHAWTFGDGGTSSLQNPMHTYTEAGLYTVELTAFGPGGTDTETKPAYVTVLEPPPIADFSADVLAGNAPLLVTFTDLSSGALSAWSWSFGDGGTSSGQHPLHFYTEPGTFTVSLTVMSPGGIDSETKVDYVAVALSLDDGSFEEQTPGGAPGSPWNASGLGHLIQPDSGILTDQDFPTHDLKWADLSSEGSDTATPPSNPGGIGTPPIGALGITQTFTFSLGTPVLLFDVAFLRGEPEMSAAANDFMSVDVSDGTTNHNLYYADTFSSFPAVSDRHALPMTERSRVQANLAALFPMVRSTTVLTLSVMLGNGGNAQNPSRGFVDNFLLGPHAGVTFLNGSGTNPAIYTSSAPVVGGVWNAEFDLAAYPSTTFTLVLTFSGGVPGSGTPFGELLLDLGSTNYFVSVAPSGIAHSHNVPNNLSFIGLTGISQGFTLSGGALQQITNAAELKLGLDTDPKPTADFSVLPTTGSAPLTVSFFDQSIGSITSHLWYFGDGSTSTLPNPMHIYVNSGTYTPTLVVSGPGGYDILNRYDLIVVP